MFHQYLKCLILPLELSALAYFRIAIGVLSLYNCLEAWYYYEEWLIDSGYLPRAELLMASNHNMLNKNVFNIYFCSGEKHIINFLLIVQTMFTISFIVGYRTKVASLFTFLFDLALKSRMYGLDYGADFLRANCLFWCMFLPIEKHWSLDSFIESHCNSKKCTPTKEIQNIDDGPAELDSSYNADDNESKNNDTRDGGFISYVLLFQIIHMYGNAGRHKYGDMWLSGVAIERVLLCHSLSKHNFIKQYLLEMPQLLRQMTKLTLALEIYAFTFFLIPSSIIRGNSAFIYICLHLGMWITLEVGMFPPVCIALLLSTLPRGTCNIIDRFLTYMFITKLKLNVTVRKVIGYISEYIDITEPLQNSNDNKKKRRWNIYRFFQKIKKYLMLLLIYVILAMDDERSKNNPKIGKCSWTYFFTGYNGILYLPESLKTIAFTFSHEQLYNLFAPDVPSNFWFEAYGIIRNKSTGEHYYYNLFTDGHLELKFNPKVNQVHQVSLALQIKAKFSRPAPNSLNIMNHRIFKLFENNLGQAVRGRINRPFARFLCREFHRLNNYNENHKIMSSDLELIGARVLKYNTHGIVQKTPSLRIPWKGLKVYGKEAVWCNDKYENHVLSFLQDVLDDEE
jgi:hypothetical protein